MRVVCHVLISLVWLFGATLVDADETIQHRKLITAEIGTAISERYIIVLNDKISDVVSKAKDLIQNSGAYIDFEYETVFKGFAVNGLVTKFLTKILDDDMIVSIIEDEVVTEDQSFQQTQSNPSNWGLDRIDKRSLPLDSTYGYTYTGKGVYIFTIDSGINLSHNEFGGRAECGLSLISGENCDDYRGHGSHVSALAGGATYGAAKEAFIVSIKVLNKDGGGSSSSVVKGIDYVASLKTANKNTPMVTNMSLGGSKNNLINSAVATAISLGVVVVTSAGNDGFNACNKSPASVETAITVAATQRDDSRASYSNYGSCVDIFAPGSSITSAWTGSNSATRTISGTSMATPIVTGVVALYLQRNPLMTPAEVKAALVADGAIGVVQNTQNSPNVLVSTAALTGSSSPVTVPAPVRAPVRAPSAPVRAPSAPVRRPSVPVSTPVRGPTSSTTTTTTKSNGRCGFFLAACQSNSDCCSNTCRGKVCFPF